MLAFVAVIGIVNFTQSHKEKSVEILSPAPIAPLSKPEPQILLARTDLSLTPQQQSALRAIESKWSIDKAELVRAMAAYRPSQARTDQISAGLAGYSELSRTYDSTRSSYWKRSYELLNKRQKALVDGGLK